MDKSNGKIYVQGKVTSAIHEDNNVSCRCQSTSKQTMNILFAITVAVIAVLLGVISCLLFTGQHQDPSAKSIVEVYHGDISENVRSLNKDIISLKDDVIPWIMAIKKVHIQPATFTNALEKVKRIQNAGNIETETAANKKIKKDEQMKHRDQRPKAETVEKTVNALKENFTNKFERIKQQFDRILDNLRGQVHIKQADSQNATILKKNFDKNKEIWLDKVTNDKNCFYQTWQRNGRVIQSEQENVENVKENPKEQTADMNKEQNVDKDLEQAVDKNEEQTVHKDKEQNVDKNEEQTVHKDIEQNVDKNEVQTVHKDIEQNVDKNEEQTVHKDIEQNVDKNEEQTVHKDKEQNVDKNEEQTVHKDKEQAVDKNEEQTVHKDKEQNVDKNEDFEELRALIKNVVTLSLELTTLSNRVKNHTDETLEQHDKEIKNIVDSQLPKIMNVIKTAYVKKSDLEARSKTTADRLAKFELRQEDITFKQLMFKELSDEMKNKMVFHDSSFYMGLISIGCCVLMFTTMVKSKGHGRSPGIRTMNTKKAKYGEYTDTYHLKWEGPMENSVCVVTFHSETERQHAEETRSVFESEGATPPTIHTRVIRRHTDIQDLPGSRVFLVFVDFNERNVILEDPSKGLGDLRVTTVRSLWKFGGDVTVIYCRDQGSRNLGGELFNRDLSSIYSQNELSKLKNQQRMLSIFEGFSDVQKQHCRHFINRQLKRD